MSQNHEVRIRRLEARIDLLSELVTQIDSAFPDRPLKAMHKGFNNYYVVNRYDQNVSEKFTSMEAAQAEATRMNAEREAA